MRHFSTHKPKHHQVFHWLSQFRVEQFPTELNISVATHTRIIALMSCLFLIDSAVLVWQVYRHEAVSLPLSRRTPWRLHMLLNLLSPAYFVVYLPC